MFIGMPLARWPVLVGFSRLLSREDKQVESVVQDA
jgi:hypothetical protein